MDRPKPVVFAVALGAASLALSLLSLALFGLLPPPDTQVSQTLGYSAFVFGYVFVFGAALLYWLWSGRNWARILSLVNVAFSLLDPVSRQAQQSVLSSAEPGRIVLWVFAGVIGLAGLIALFLPSSHRWFMALRPKYEGELARGFGWFLIAVGAICLGWFFVQWLGGVLAWEGPAAALFWGGIGYAFVRRYKRAPAA